MKHLPTLREKTVSKTIFDSMCKDIENAIIDRMWNKGDIEIELDLYRLKHSVRLLLYDQNIRPQI